ncbi:ATP-binding protein [Rarobacter faecitabidus]|uniref:AAA+ ATPase domain-containing protein n=1 Tax=Rarobacter faecitabidus TaxID=13243 RepID=A0A542ZNW2_RARFA|nr:hypothetical protein FB461_1668 [Rarobacter faecitabidus]
MNSPQPFSRHLEPQLSEALADTPVIVIQGARQVGKSTLAGWLADQRESVLVTLDDPAVQAVALSDPGFFVTQADERMLVVDEAQRAPGIILPLKATVDRDRRPGRFLLTGSADLLQVKGIGDSLAGRAEAFDLWPLSQGELARRTNPEDFVTWLLETPAIADSERLVPEVVLRGGYPEVQGRSETRARAWFESYATRLADHDARELAGGGYSDQLRALLSILAASGQHEVVRARLARELSVAENTVAAYLRTATIMRLITHVPSWGRSLRGRAAKRPKTSLNDTGFAASLTGFTARHSVSIGGREFYGALVEQFVALEIAKQRAWSATSYRIHHYRDTDGLEVDLILELADGRLVAIEVKSATDINEKAWRNVERFRDRFHDREVIGVCLYAGDRSWRLHDWLHVLPITSLWQHEGATP